MKQQGLEGQLKSCLLKDQSLQLNQLQLLVPKYRFLFSFRPYSFLFAYLASSPTKMTIFGSKVEKISYTQGPKPLQEPQK